MRKTASGNCGYADYAEEVYMKAQIVRVVLNADREDDRRILDYLRYAGKPMSKLFKMAMHEFLDRQDRAYEEELNLAGIRKVIREELKNLNVLGVGGSDSQRVFEYDDEPEVSPLDFLEELEKMGNS